ncbi:substrate-binding domain-containing protein [Streptomyces sp. HNM0663]|uniref:Substrate-binding domain-containing protein n=1 Tax=Streptomyces chengmaiensis TaxID=3040919 RepID=A0ABT6HRA9_9ACTN|nr:substrate-binding domain-containing protein [Streptomyces chengmaiensis]MDH2391145.1 substrate-binding domain-containing protein [Streptomyces chengmaiensis]
MRNPHMKSRPGRAAVLVAALTLAAGLTACGQAADSNTAPDQGGGARGAVKIGLLLPDTYTARWENFDRPLIENRIEELCPDCTVEYANAQGNVSTQQRQMESMITQGVDVLILDAVDPQALENSVRNAAEVNLPVVAYDRLAEGPIAAYVSFDGAEVGRLQGEGLLEAMGDKADGGQIVMMNGDPSDPNSAWFEEGARSVLEGRVKIGKSYDTVGWRSENAHVNMAGAIAALGADNIDGVYSANDALAFGIISALKANYISPLPPVTGQDAELAAVQRIVEGEQTMTVYKPFKPQAEAAAAIAVALGRGEPVDTVAEDEIDNMTAEEIPAVLLTPIAVTVDNIVDTLVKDGMYTIDQICTPKYASACERAGLTT